MKARGVVVAPGRGTGALGGAVPVDMKARGGGTAPGWEAGTRGGTVPGGGVEARGEAAGPGGEAVPGGGRAGLKSALPCGLGALGASSRKPGHLSRRDESILSMAIWRLRCPRGVIP
ncbi:MAG: hypothetical protein LBT40_00050 [Deltaproteobacteria bacterium]|nr:hypothetical protein [Deltaproteobacteria bacterium]